MIFFVVGQDVFEPVKRLDDARRRPAGPIEFAGFSVFEVDGEVAELDGLQSRSRSRRWDGQVGEAAMSAAALQTALERWAHHFL